MSMLEMSSIYPQQLISEAKIPFQTCSILYYYARSDIKNANKWPEILKKPNVWIVAIKSWNTTALRDIHVFLHRMKRIN